jgi:hypothetical protein
MRENGKAAGAGTTAARDTTLHTHDTAQLAARKAHIVNTYVVGNVTPNQADRLAARMRQRYGAAWWSA